MTINIFKKLLQLMLYTFTDLRVYKAHKESAYTQIYIQM